jgi:hypothetical protein
METATTMAPVAVARVARALTYLVYAFVLLAIVVLLFGFFLLLFGANPDAPFAILFAMIVYGLAALVLRALIEWLTDQIAEMGYAR